MKYFYKGFGLFVLFCASLFIFGQHIPSINVGTATATSLQSSAFPLINLTVNKYTINTLHGYSSELDSGNIRESITPIGADKSFDVVISENDLKIKRLDYDLKDIANDKSIGSGTLSAFDESTGTKTAHLTLDAAMNTSTEYGLEITLTTNYSKRIHFYTRVKYYDSDFFLKQKLDFVNKFHNATFGKEKGFDINNYLETNGSNDSTLANVNIYSSKKLITWNKLKPKMLSVCTPTIKELNIETAAVEQVYYVQTKTNTGTETYQVKEFYRVRYTTGRIYLLYFQRTMEAVFDPELTSTSQSEFKIGISNVDDLNISSSEDNKKMAFVRNGNLWYYDLSTEKLNQVFSFVQDSTNYIQDYYDQHDIRIINIDNDGNIDFVVYGYMNCGDYEGRVGIILYSYDSKKNQINERIYLPLETSFQQLKEDFGDFCYVNRKNVFYFSLYDRVYAYNITSRQYTVLTRNASSGNFAMLEKAKCFVWSNATSQKPATRITILDLETEQSRTVSAKKNQSIKVLGAIDSSVVYGFVRNSDIYNSQEGERISPVYKLIIADSHGDILKEYETKNVYIIKTVVDKDIIQLKRVRKIGQNFKKISDDSIQHQQDNKAKSFDLASRVTDKMLTEKYISLPAGFVMKGEPKITYTKYVMETENTTFYINNPQKNAADKYYIYAYGGITGSNYDAGTAIRQADEQMGVVMDNRNHIIWERGGKFLSNTVSLMDKTTVSGNVSSMKACLHMLLQSAQVTEDASLLKGASTMDILKKYISTPVNLTGCTVDEILYFVSSGKPVIAMKNSSQAVLINSYNSSSVSWFDPSTGSNTKMSLNGAEKFFENAGYVFISYI